MASTSECGKMQMPVDGTNGGREETISDIENRKKLVAIRKEGRSGSQNTNKEIVENEDSTDDFQLVTSKKQRKRKSKKNCSCSEGESRYELMKLNLRLGQLMSTIERLEEEKKQLAARLARVEMNSIAIYDQKGADATARPDADWSNEVNSIVDEIMEDVAPPATMISPSSTGAIPKKQQQPIHQQPDQPQQQRRQQPAPLKQAAKEDNNNNGTNTQMKKINGDDRTKGKASPPVIKVYGSDVKSLTYELRVLLGHNLFTINIMNRNLISLQLSKTEEHTKVREFLMKKGLDSYTYTPKELKPCSLMVEGLSGTYEIDDLKLFLEECGLTLNVMGVIKLRGDRWIVQLGGGSDIKGFFRIRYILSCRVRIARYKREGLAQCRNCQRFGHVASNCGMKFRCVKCGRDHGPAKCEVPNKEANTEENITTDPVTGQVVRRVGRPVYCANCKAEGHVASSRDCPKRIELLERIKERRTAGRLGIRVPIAVPPPPPPIRPGTSATTFANMMRTSRPATNTAPVGPTGMASRVDGNMRMFDEECKRLLGGDFVTCMKKVSEYAATFTKFRTDEEKMRGLFGLFFTLGLDG
ncbi:uncharacterized protein LOC131995567 [Stomoxys calcitrans]|uniref:uncharacterized protein LOC131995567 n=1 Tax=Stomoxys calcitrans TaxID=35570 RepID=UPI0027E36F05|nr:uncharacterized protein LOC131995567 [Stomoxys calcitrans]